MTSHLNSITAKEKTHWQGKEPTKDHLILTIKNDLSLEQERV